MSRVLALPKELRDLLSLYSTSGPYILSRLPKDIQEKLLWYLGPDEIITINNNFPDLVWGYYADFWTRKSNYDLGKKCLFADDVRDYLLYVIANQAGIFDREDVQQWMCDNKLTYGTSITSFAGEEAAKTGNYSMIDRMMAISPGKVIFGAHDTLYDYIYTKYPKYRLPLMFMEATYGKRDRVDLSVVSEKDTEYWMDRMDEPDPFEESVDEM